VPLKLTVIVQLPEAAMVLPQVVVSAKLLAFVPLSVMPLIVNGTVPSLVSVTLCEVTVEPTAVSGKAIEVPATVNEGVAREAASATVAEPPVVALLAITRFAA
jgi:hypothetical protein